MSLHSSNGFKHAPTTPGNSNTSKSCPNDRAASPCPVNRSPRRFSACLASRGIEQLYCHQVAALEAARAGRDLVVVTGTASGKTLCYNLPILEAAIATGARALYLFPTKALAQDQLKGCSNWLPTIRN